MAKKNRLNPLGLQFKDEEPDAASLLKKVADNLEEQGKAFDALKKKNDEQEKKYDGLLKEEVKNINTAMSKMAEEHKAEVAAFNATISRLNQQGTRSNMKSEDKNRIRTEMGLKSLKAYIAGDDHKLSDSDLKSIAEEHGVTVNEIKAMSSDSGPRGGFLVPLDTSGRIVKRIYETSVIAKLANVQQTSAPVLEGFRDEDEASAAMVGERAARAETNTPNVGKWAVAIHEGYAFPKVTQTEADDAGWDVESWLTGKVSDKLSRLRENKFVMGTGSGEPYGLIGGYAQNLVTTAKAAHVNNKLNVYKSGVNGGLTDADKLVMMIYSLKKQYRFNANWLCGRDMLEVARVIKQDSKYIWAPSVLNVDGQARIGSMDGTILGYPVEECNDFADIATDTVGMLFGDIRETYQIAERQGMRMLRDNLTVKPYIGLYTTIRFGGAVLNFESYSGLKLSA